ncbi:MAG: host-nuclease inhibitor Gam family protein, partial [Selenomonadaceae bacterium]|nr:host-nuclease inhibitor Gam family protein [Selenomonadaceae bacterium]
KQNPPTGKRKSLKFACGSFGYRKSSTKFFRDGCELNADNPDLLTFAKTAHPEYVKVKESVDWAKLKNALDFDDENVFFKDTGEILPDVKPQKNFFVESA